MQAIVEAVNPTGGSLTQFGRRGAAAAARFGATAPTRAAGPCPRSVQPSVNQNFMPSGSQQAAEIPSNSEAGG
jgi:hypothetical protein